MQRSLPYLLAVLCLAALPASEAFAQQGGEKLRLGAGMVLDFAGGAEYDPSGGGPSYNDDARVSPGFRFHLDYDVARYVSIGGLARFEWWKGEDAYDDDRNMLVDIALRVNGHYDWRDFRFYGVFGIGPTISRLGSDNADRYNKDNPAVGVAASISPGAEYWFSNRVGLFLEMFGWSGHFFSHDNKVGNGNVDFRINQVVWQFGLVFAP